LGPVQFVRQNVQTKAGKWGLLWHSLSSARSASTTDSGRASP